MEIRLVLTAFIVLSFRLTHGESTNQEGHSKIQDKLRDLFESINDNDSRKTKDVRNILEREAAREQQVFDTVKEDLRLTRQRSAHKQKGIEHKMALKREAPKTPKGPEPPDASYDKVTHIRKNAAEEFPPKYWFGRWETIPLKDNLAPYIQAKEKFLPDESSTWDEIRDLFAQQRLDELKKYCAEVHKRAGNGTIKVLEVLFGEKKLSFNDSENNPRKVDVLSYSIDKNVTKDRSYEYYAYPEKEKLLHITQGWRPDCIYYLRLFQTDSDGNEEFRINRPVCGTPIISASNCSLT